MEYLNLIKLSLNLWDYRKTDEVSKDLLKKDFTVTQGLILYLVLFSITMLILTIPLLVSGELLDVIFVAGYVFGIVLGLLLGISLIFLGALWSHLFIKLFKGDKHYLDTVKVFLVLMIPYLLFQVVYTVFTAFVEILVILGGELFYILNQILTLIILVVLVYYLVICAKTYAITHNMGIQNAVLAGVSSIAAALVVMGIIFAILFLIVFSLGLGTRF